MSLDINQIATVVRDLMVTDQLVQTVYLYGSYAKGKPTPQSDVDLGVVLQDERTHLEFELERYLDELSEKLGTKVQLSILSQEKSGSLFLHEVVSQGKVLIDNQSKERLKKETQIMIDFADYQVWIKADQFARLKKSVQG